jgi:dihydrofolate synthase/folylpolyglutamate synthase
MLETIGGELGVKTGDASDFLPPVGTQAGGYYFVEVMGRAIEIASPLQGAHQQRNVALAIAASAELAAVHGFPVSPSAISEGIRRTCWSGRLERIQSGGVEWILDVAHNPAGVEALRSWISGFLSIERQRILIFSCLRDKPLKELARILFPLFKEVIFAPIHSVRATAMEELKAAGRETGITVASAESVREALQWANDRAQGGIVIISGSVYLVGEARSLLQGGGVE